VEREITEQMDKLVQERVAECLKTHIPQELQDEVARSKRELKQNLLGRAVEPTQISDESLPVVAKMMTGRRPRLRPFI